MNVELLSDIEMKKVMLRKDYQTEVVPVDEAVGRYLVKKVTRSWTEKFVDEDTLMRFIR